MKKRSRLLLILITAALLACQITSTSINTTLTANSREETQTSKAATNSIQPGWGTPTPPPSLRTTPTGYDDMSGSTIKRDVTYCRMDEVQLKADLYLHINANDPVPLLIHIHGGGWTTGDKRGGDGFMKFDPLVNAGFSVASINYRLAPDYKMADMIADVRCAVRSFRAHATEYNIDPDRIGVWGESAGAQLAALLGTMDDGFSAYDIGEYSEFSSRVQAVVDLFGPSDFISWYSDGSHRGLGPTTESIFGSDDIYDPIYTDASPVTHISSDDPPFLILHGNADETVPLSQSQEFYTKLLAAGVDAQLVVVKGGNHGLMEEAEVPSRDAIIQLIVDFFTEKLLK
jgi:acetyl esterase/lipase